MKRLIERLTGLAAPVGRLVALLVAALTTAGAWASVTKTNPVTDETETYANTFTGETAEWNSTANWDTSMTPFISGDTQTYNSALVSGKTASTSTALDGFTLRVGAYDGASIMWDGGITKIQGNTTGCWLTADAMSLIRIASFAGNQLENNGNNVVFKLTSANAGGITWTTGLSSTSGYQNLQFQYYLGGNGTVVYGGDITVNNPQVIKMADVTLSGNEKSVQAKTLVTFGSGTTKTFTADATIKVYGADGMTLAGTENLASVRQSSTAIENTTSILAASDRVGSCELVQCTDGIVLFYVDGVTYVAKTYLPSININFTSSASYGLTTAADVGLSGYAVPGTSWNNFAVANATFSSVNAVDSTGTASEAAGVSVAISGTRGAYSCSTLAAASNPLHGYIDEEAAHPTPTVTISGIPYARYRVIVYHSTDTANVPFGYDTINGTDYTYENGELTEGTAAWGDSGASNSANAIAAGVNALVTGELSGPTLTVVGHRAGGNANARGCIAAIQIIEVAPTIGDNDLLITLSGDQTYTFDEVKAYDNVYVAGSGTLTFSGSACTAANLNIALNATVNMNGSALTPTTVTGFGTVVYDGSQPPTTLGFNDSTNWQGTVWVKNIGTYNSTGKADTCLGSSSVTADANTINGWGNASSFVKFTNIKGYMSTAAIPWTLILEDENNNYAWYNNNGWGDRTVTIAGLKGDGTLYDQQNMSGNACNQLMSFTDVSAFTGTVNVYGKRIVMGEGDTTTTQSNYGTIEVTLGKSAIVAAGKTWTAAWTGDSGGYFVVNGTLNVNGTLVSSHASKAVSGSGTVVFTGRAPTPVDGENETKWWKNASWTGTVQIKDVTNLVGTSDSSGTYIDFNQYGHADSIVELNNVIGWINHNYTCTPKFKVTGTLSLTNGWSGANEAFKVGTLLGSGTISGSSSAPTMVFNVTDDWSGFIGTFGLSNKCIVFGSTIPDSLTRGTIYVTEGTEVTMQQTSGIWWAEGGIKVDGTLKASDRSKWGAGTAITLGDTGVLELTSTGNTEDYNDYSTVTGTGTIKYSSTAGWRTFPVDEAKMPATTLTIQTELADSLIITRDANRETVIGNLAGTKNIRSDWNPSGSGAENHPRTLTVTQSKDTEWQGKFVRNRITQFNVAGTGGTLTLSGTQDATIPANITGSVNLTGTWVGDVTVSGTFGGTGTLTGNLTLNSGAVINVNDISLPLTVTGGFAASGAIEIRLPAGTSIDAVVDIISIGGGIDSNATFTVYVGGNRARARVSVRNGKLRISPLPLAITLR